MYVEVDPYQFSILAMPPSRTNDCGPFKRSVMGAAPVYKELQRATQANYLHALEVWDR